MKSKNLFYFLALASILVLSGCVGRTYSLTRDRIDQDLGTGNRGFIMGKAPAEESTVARKDTRTVRVFEIELGPTYRAKNVNVKESTPAQNITNTELTTKEAGSETVVSEQAAVSGPSEKYTVGKNDTLQKISKKFYGTTKKWTKIYEANKDVLKGPDKVYPGQVLNIPDVSSLKTDAKDLKEPKENLK